MDEFQARMSQREATLSAKVFDKDGNLIKDYGVISTAPMPLRLKRGKFEIVCWFLAGALLFVLLEWLFNWPIHLLGSFAIFGLVTNAGVAYEAAAFAGGAAVSNFNFHDSGTGTNAAAVTDTTLQTPTGIARVSGVQTTPGSTNIYQTVATITYNATFAITEWGLFSAASGGTLWDHRVFSALNVVNTNAIQFTYQLTIPSGGS